MSDMGTPPLPPDMQHTLERLFEMFSAYTAARNPRERRDIHAQVLELFSRLGVVSDSVLVRQAADMFDRIKQEPVTRTTLEPTLAKTARDLVAERIRLFEKGPGMPSLSKGARQFLRVPVVETAEYTSQFDAELTVHSLDRGADESY